MSTIVNPYVATFGGGGGGSFPTAALLDDFNRTNENPLANGNWQLGIQGTFDVGAVKIVSNQVVVHSLGAGGGAAARWNTSTFGPNVEARMTMSTITGGSAHSLWFRLTNPGASNVTGYAAIYRGGDFQFRVYRVNNDSSFTQLGSNLNVAQLHDGDAFGITMIGSVITIWKRYSGVWGADATTFSDGTYTGAGNIGFQMLDGAIDDFGGGTI